MSCKSKCISENYTDCIYYSGADIENECFSICKGKTQTEINQEFAEAICNGQSYTVKINEEDECPGYLYEKITSTTLDIDVTTSGDCKTLTINLNTPEWEDIELEDDYENQGAQDAQAYVDGIGHVYLRGRITATDYPSNTSVCTLNIPYRPTNTVHIPVTVNNAGTYYPGELQIQTSGLVSLLANSAGWTGTEGTFSLNMDFFID